MPMIAGKHPGGRRGGNGSGGLSRRGLLRGSAALGGLALPGPGGARGALAQTPPRPLKVYYNDDSTFLANTRSPYEALGQEVSTGEIEAAVDEAAAAGVDAYVNQPGHGWFPFWQSAIVPPAEEARWFQATYGRPEAGVQKYVAEGGDVVAAVLRRCRHHKLPMIASVRLNDIHGIVFSGRDKAYIQAHMQDPAIPAWQRTWPYPMSRIHAEHPEWRLVPGSNKPEDMSWNWAIPEALAHKTALFGELPRRYDIDGLELDFMRYPRLYADDVPQEKRIQLTMGFIRDMRQALDSGRKGRQLALRLPPWLAALPKLGLDVKALRAAGVNRLTLSSHTFTNQDLDLQAFRAATPGLELTLEMAQAKTVLAGSPPRWRNDDGLVLSTPDDDISTAALAQAAGFDSISLFNFVYYRQSLYAQPGERPHEEPPFRVVPELKQPLQACETHRSWYASAIWGMEFSRAQLPARLRPGTPLKVQSRVPQVSQSGRPGILRLGWRGPGDLPLSVALNGRPLSPATQLPGWLPQEAFGANSSLWTVPPDLIRAGENEVELRSTQPGELRFVGIALPC